VERNRGDSSKASLNNAVDIIFVANRRSCLEILYYCPACGSVNQIVDSTVIKLRCHDCLQFNDASDALVCVNQVDAAVGE
jgi:hypothetical protein